MGYLKTFIERKFKMQKTTKSGRISEFDEFSTIRSCLPFL